MIWYCEIYQVRKSYTYYLIWVLVFTSLISFGQSFEPGETYFSNNEYIEYISGNLPIVISAPHGGELEPSEIPDRDCTGCVYVKDSYTQELIRETKDAIYEITGCYTHSIINRLHRRKLDANRGIIEAADGNIESEEAWMAFHNFIDSAKFITNQEWGAGLYIDLHGHGHDIQRIELGYLLSASELRGEDEELNEENLINKSSISELVASNLNSFSHSELIRGQYSFGSLLDDHTYQSVPSDEDLFPFQGDPYFSGGYNTARHKDSQWGEFNSIQIECNQDIRFTDSARKQFARELAEVILDFLELHSFPDLPSKYCTTLNNNVDYEQRIKIYPNPTSDYFVLSTDEFAPTIIIFDMLGKQIISRKFNNGENTIDVSKFNKGLYFLFVYENKSLKKQFKISIP